MGAWAFTTTAWGKTPQEAFRAAVADAQYEHGHGGYTGTIAEKGTFSLFELPPRVKAVKFLDLVEKATQLSYGTYATEEVKRLEESLVREAAKHEREVARFERTAGPLLPLVRRAAAVYDDKWGPAVAVEVKASEAAAVTRAPKPGRGYRLFLFAGYASS